MTIKARGYMLVAVVSMCGSILQAQAPAGTPAHGPGITVIGCIQKEVEVLRTSPGNLGLADEYVLSHSEVKSGAGSPPAGVPSSKGVSGRDTPDAAATLGRSGRVYRLTGEQEHQLKQHLGQRIEIVGSFDDETDAQLEAKRNTAPSAAAKTPDRRPTAHDVPEITIRSFRSLGVPCTDMVVK